MDIGLTATILLPIGLDLIGFVEPCTVGAHMVFLGSQDGRPRAARLAAFGIFALLRVTVMAGFGALVALLGLALVGAQTGFWLVFGALYLGIGLALLVGGGGWLKRRVSLAPGGWKWAASPAVQGAAFGLNIPACAAPLIFALLGLTASGASMGAGALTMALSGAALSLPLAPLLFWDSPHAPLQRLADKLLGRAWVLGLIFLALGLWSTWFGVYLDPADWSGL